MAAFGKTCGHPWNSFCLQCLGVIWNRLSFLGKTIEWQTSSPLSDRLGLEVKGIHNVCHHPIGYLGVISLLLIFY